MYQIDTKNLINIPILKKKVIKLKLKNQTDWFLYYKNNEFKDKFPRNPQRTYYKEWKGWGDFLGTGNSRKYFLSYNNILYGSNK